MAAPRAVELADIPQMDVGAPMPLALASDSSLLLSFLLRDGGSAVVVFDRAIHHSFGHPNDEVLHGHPLYAAGLQPYAACEVFDSPLIASLAKINSVHPRHDPARFSTLRHIVFTFHDSMFECVARTYDVTTSEATSTGERFDQLRAMIRL